MNTPLKLSELPLRVARLFGAVVGNGEIEGARIMRKVIRTKFLPIWKAPLMKPILVVALASVVAAGLSQGPPAQYGFDTALPRVASAGRERAASTPRP